MQATQKIFMNIFLRFKIHKRLKKWRKLAKKSKQRLFILKQWLETQINYANKLISLRDNVRNPLLQNQLISEMQELIMFPNLDSMIQLSQQMKGQIGALIEIWDPIKTELAPTVNKLIHFLKIYKDFSNNYMKGDAILQTLKQHKKFGNVVKVQNIEDLFSKPFQRPLQYKLFIDSYLKEMRQTHLDYKQLKNALEQLKIIANSINQRVQEQLRNQKLYKLENMFGGILENSTSRSYLSQFIATHIDTSCRVYVFNDLLFVSKVVNNHKQQKYMSIKLSPNSFVVLKKQIRTYPYTLFVCGLKQNIHLSFTCLSQVESAYQKLSQTIDKLYQKYYSRQQMISKYSSTMKKTVKKKNQYEWKDGFQYYVNLRLTIVGVIPRTYPSQDQKAIFVVKIQIGKPQQIFQLAYYDLQHLKTIERDFLNLYPYVELPRVQNKFKNSGFQDFKSDLTLFYDHRSIQFQSKLNYIIRSKPIVTRPQLFLHKLKVHESIWKYIEKNTHDCSCDACLSSQIFTDWSYYQLQKASILNPSYKFCVNKAYNAQKTIKSCICAAQLTKASIQQKLIWQSCYNNYLQQSFHPRYTFGSKFTFKVHINEDNEQISIKIQAHPQDTAYKIIQQICKKKGIKTSLDFRLALVHDNKTFYIHHGEYIYNIAKYMLQRQEITQQKHQSKRSRFLSTFSFNKSQTYESISDTSNKPKILLRKPIVFKSELEQATCEQNPERYSFILGQILYRFKHELLPLSVGDIKILTAFAYSIQQFSILSMSNKIHINQEKVKNFFPQSKRNFISKQILDQIEEIVQNQIKACDRITSLYRCIMKHIGQKAGWKSQFFRVINMNPMSLSGGNMDLLIGINYQKLTVSLYNINVSLLEFRLEELKCSVTGNIIRIQQESTTYEFKCNNINFLETLLNIYKTIRQFETGKLK